MERKAQVQFPFPLFLLHSLNSPSRFQFQFQFQLAACHSRAKRAPNKRQRNAKEAQKKRQTSQAECSPASNFTPTTLPPNQPVICAFKFNLVAAHQSVFSISLPLFFFHNNNNKHTSLLRFSTFLRSKSVENKAQLAQCITRLHRSRFSAPNSPSRAAPFSPIFA